MITQFPNGQTAPGRPPAAESDDLNLRQIFLTLWRRKFLIAFIIVALTTLCYVGIGRLTPRYTAEAVLVLDVRQTNVVDIQPAVVGLSREAAMTRSEVDILYSRTLAAQVVRALGLAEDPEFNPRLRPHEPGLLERIGAADWLPGPLRRRLTGESPKGEAAQAGKNESVFSQVVGRVLGKLTVSNDGRSYTIILRFTSEDPEKAARVVNAFADTYLQNQLDTKYGAVERTAVWLDDKLKELRERVRVAENAVQRFKEQHSIIDLPTGTLTVQQLVNLSSQLIAARADRARAEAELNVARTAASSPDQAKPSPQAAASPLVQNLRAQEINLVSQLAELRSRYGERHPQVINAGAELRELRARLQQEINRFLAGLEANVQEARSREQALQARVDELGQLNTLDNRAAVELLQLESEATAVRSLFDTFLRSLDRTTVQMDILQPDARIVTRAGPPNWPSYPPRQLLLGVSIIGSLLFSLIIVLVLEFFDQGFRTSDELEREFGVPVLGLVPAVRARGTGSSHPSSYALKKPLSPFAESVRSVRTAVQFSRPDRSPRVVLVTSAVPDEGKTTLALTLARLTASAGQKVMLIDCDLRRPTVAKDLGIDCERGLTDLLAGKASMEEVVRIDDKSGMMFIPGRGKSTYPVELLNSRRMQKLVENAAELNDLVILDSPPVALVSDAVVLSEMADATLLTVHWGRTPGPLVLAALKKFASANAPVTGLVLTRVNLSHRTSYGPVDYASSYAKRYYAAG